jgi:hypothetical protein
LESLESRKNKKLQKIPIEPNSVQIETKIYQKKVHIFYETKKSAFGAIFDYNQIKFY